jgi:hypothetical protein
VFVAKFGSGGEEVKPFPVANPGFELDAKQMREPEDGRALALRVGMDSVWLHIRVVFYEVVQDVVAFPRAASGEPGEESDLHVRDHEVAVPANRRSEGGTQT